MEIEVEKILESRTDGTGHSPLERLHGIRQAWLGWSAERLQEEVAEVLGREEPVPVEELPGDDLRKLIGTWEPVHSTT